MNHYGASNALHQPNMPQNSARADAQHETPLNPAPFLSSQSQNGPTPSLEAPSMGSVTLPHEGSPHPFVSRRSRYVGPNPAPKYPSTRDVRVSSAARHSAHNFSAIRSVSFPSHVNGLNASPRPRSTLGTSLHTNRVVSLPEKTSSVGSMRFASHSQEPSLPTVDELQPLIDLSTPPRAKHLDADMSPNSSMIVHTSFSASSDDAPSPPSSPEISETEIIVGSPNIGRADSFLHRYPQASSEVKVAPQFSTPEINTSPGVVETTGPHHFPPRFKPFDDKLYRAYLFSPKAYPCSSWSSFSPVRSMPVVSFP
ncbi:hypothetical protein DL93DRAFT_1742782 [Clavulina sp. PMI_390]|nr:hypothetical protein DL93DRAFT_1742782 [Clavulina sp. PMI_390]